MDSGHNPTALPDLAGLFNPDPAVVADAVATALADDSPQLTMPARLDRIGTDATTALATVTPYLRGGGRNLGHPGFLAHMDPPTPWVAWVAALLGASSNQNLLHTDTGPAARILEATVIDWLAPVFGMSGGHLVPGSTVANLTALWAARDLTGADTVVASTAAHLSIKKAAAILGLRHIAVAPGSGEPEDESGRGGNGRSAKPSSGSQGPNRFGLTGADLATVFAADADRHGGPVDPASTIVVVTAGTTAVGAIDELDPQMPVRPGWIHVDAAWAGPLRFSAEHLHRLAGIDRADSIAISAHKWLYQPKESALVLFGDVDAAHDAVSVDGAYLQVPNVGVLGSHGTAAAPLAATLLHLGLDGVEQLIDHGMALADRLVDLVDRDPDLDRLGPNQSGVVVWRHRAHNSRAIQAELVDAFVSTVEVDGTTWLRSVAANPMADPDRVVAAVGDAARRLSRG